MRLSAAILLHHELRCYSEDQLRDDAGKWTKQGGSAPYEQHRKDYAREEPETFDWNNSTEEQRKAYLDDPATHQKFEIRRQREKEWTQSMQEALSLGKVTPEEAQKRGYYGMGHDQGDHGLKWTALPQELYYVTTAKDAVLQTGLKSRKELGQESGLGLGGGESESVSFATSKEGAENLYHTMHEARQVASGEISIERLMKAAETGREAKRPFLTDVVKQYSGRDWNPGDPLPLNLQALLEGRNVEQKMAIAEDELPPGGKFVGYTWMGGDNRLRGGTYTVPATEEELQEHRFDFFKKFLFFRESAGGPEDPLFFGSDVKGLGKVDPKQIAVLKLEPQPGAQGYPMGALTEWRTHSGKAVKLVNVETPLPKIRAYGEGRRIKAGGPGSGCRGSNCGRPKGSGSALEQGQKELEQHQSSSTLERVMIFDAVTGEKLQDYVGSENSIDRSTYDGGQLYLDRQIIEMHSHPDTSSFSDGDWKAFAWSHVVEARVVGSDNVFILQKGPEWESRNWAEHTPRKIGERWNQIFDEHTSLERDWDPETVLDGVNRQMADEFGVTFIVKPRESRTEAIKAGGPGSGCRGPNCGRPKGSGTAGPSWRAGFPHVSLEKSVYRHRANAALATVFAIPDLASLLKEHPLPELLFAGDRTFSTLTGGLPQSCAAAYSKSRKHIVVAPSPGLLNRPWLPGKSATTMEGFKTETEQDRAMLLHELGHYVHCELVEDTSYSWGDGLQRRWRDCWKEMSAGGRGSGDAITQYAGVSPQEYFAESFAAYFVHKKDLKALDPTMYNLVGDVVALFGSKL